MKLKTNKEFLHRRILGDLGRCLILLTSPFLALVIATFKTLDHSSPNESPEFFYRAFKFWLFVISGCAIGGAEAGYYRLFTETGSCGPTVWKWSRPKNKNWKWFNPHGATWF